MNLICENCGKEFYRRKKHKGSEKSFCCYACFQEYKKRTGYMKVLPDLVCDNCGKTYHANGSRQANRSSYHFCSAECQRLYQRKGEMVACPVCGKAFMSNDDHRTYCSRECSSKARMVYGTDCERKRHRRHLMAENGDVDHSITLAELIRRDNNVCQICGKKCDQDDYSLDGETFIAGDMYPSIDHVIPIAKGGVHQWSNIQLAHRICNSRKSSNSAYKEKGGQICFDI